MFSHIALILSNSCRFRVNSIFFVWDFSTHQFSPQIFQNFANPANYGPHTITVDRVLMSQTHLVSLNFSMLNRFVIQESVQFHSFVGCSTIFILGRVFTDPEVNIVQQSVRIILFVRVQNDVRVTVVEATWKAESFLFGRGQSLFHP